MEKQDVQRILREKMKMIGFKAKRNFYYKTIEDDYVVAVWLDHHPYCKGYFIEYGVIFMEEGDRLSFNGFCDWRRCFEFMQIQEDGMEHNNDKNTLDYFLYEENSEQYLMKALDINITKKLVPIFDKEFVLNDYRKNIYRLVRLPQKKVEKILKYGGFDMFKVEKIEEGIKW